jgi:hypothetical protein
MYGAQFPQYLSKPYQVLWFEPDDIALIVVSAVIFGTHIGGWLGWLMVVLVPIGYGRLKRNYPRGFIKHVGYFLGIMSFRGYPTYFQQKFRE